VKKTTSAPPLVRRKKYPLIERKKRKQARARGGEKKRADVKLRGKGETIATKRIPGVP